MANLVKDYVAVRMPTAERPRRLRFDPNRGWNAGADGVTSASANCTYTFSVELAEQIVVGIGFDRPDSTRKDDIAHGFVMTMQDGQAMYSIVEYGAVQTAPVAFVNGAATQFKVLRTSGVITYQVNGAQVFTSLKRSSEVVSSATSLFAAGDAVIDSSFVDLGGTAVASTGEGYGTIRVRMGDSTSALRPARMQSTPQHEWPVATVGYSQSGPLAFHMSGSDVANHGTGVVGPFFVQGRSYGPSTFSALVANAAAQLEQSLGTAFVSDTLSVAGDTVATDVALLIDALRIAAATLHSAESNVLLADNMGFEGSLLASIQMLLTDSVAFGGDAAAVSLAVERLVDALMLTGQAASQSEAFTAVVATISFAMLVAETPVTMTADSFGISSPVTNSVLFGNLVTDQLVMSSLLTGTAMLVVAVADSLTMDGSVETVLDAATAISDSVSFGIRIKLDTGEYVAYALNTETLGLTKYTNYPFNSFAKIGGRYYGASDSGLYLLEGDDDAGTPMAARARMAFTSLGISASKRVSSVFLAYTSTGALRLKVFTIGPDGNKRADYYRLNPQTTGDMREARIKIGQGLRSVYWGFEIEAIDGAAFEIDLVAIHPLVLERRTHGQGGGKR